jgi:hypothetical protein
MVGHDAPGPVVVGGVVVGGVVVGGVVVGGVAVDGVAIDGVAIDGVAIDGVVVGGVAVDVDVRDVDVRDVDVRDVDVRDVDVRDVDVRDVLSVGRLAMADCVKVSSQCQQTKAWSSGSPQTSWTSTVGGSSVSQSSPHRIKATRVGDSAAPIGVRRYS